jgi:hypothetical protein
MNINVIYIQGSREGQSPFESFKVLHSERNCATAWAFEKDVDHYAFEAFYYNPEMVKAHGGWMKLDDEFGSWRRVEVSEREAAPTYLVSVRPMTEDEINDYAEQQANEAVLEMREWARYPRTTTNPEAYWQEVFEATINRKRDPFCA